MSFTMLVNPIYNLPSRNTSDLVFYLKFDMEVSWCHWRTFTLLPLKPPCHMLGQKLSWVKVDTIDDVCTLLVGELRVHQDVGVPVLGQALVGGESAHFLLAETRFYLPAKLEIVTFQNKMFSDSIEEKSSFSVFNCQTPTLTSTQRKYG